MIVKLLAEGFSDFCNCIITYTWMFVMRDQLVCWAKVTLTSYSKRSPAKEGLRWFLQSSALRPRVHPGRSCTKSCHFLGAGLTPAGGTVPAWMHSGVSEVVLDYSRIVSQNQRERAGCFRPEMFYVQNCWRNGHPEWMLMKAHMMQEGRTHQ